MRRRPPHPEVVALVVIVFMLALPANPGRSLLLSADDSPAVVEAAVRVVERVWEIEVRLAERLIDLIGRLGERVEARFCPLAGSW
jgi:hypothetical protein